MKVFNEIFRIYFLRIAYRNIHFIKIISFKVKLFTKISI